MGVVQPPQFLPPCSLPLGSTPDVAYVWKTEEKGSDVSLGVHLVRDALKGYFDVAAVLTNDTDLVEPVRIVGQELNFPVILLMPVAKPATSLQAVASENGGQVPVDRQDEQVGPGHLTHGEALEGQVLQHVPAPQRRLEGATGAEFLRQEAAQLARPQAGGEVLIEDHHPESPRRACSRAALRVRNPSTGSRPASQKPQPRRGDPPGGRL
jgi:hypothetical protein